MRERKGPEYWSLIKIKSRIEEIYKELRELTTKLMDLNVKQYENQILKEDVYVVLLELANKHLDLEEELFRLENIVKERTKSKISEKESS